MLISQSVIVSNIVTGKSSPSLDNLLKIADALGVDILYLLYGEKKHEDKTTITCPPNNLTSKR
ncbi:MAG: helix-turn-helix domain-containing protein [Tannerellaceae bacterium]|jgi:transcriptional regulator with XRE-family HTH domain|nr:helix-turn-helix domain-containing protein [Tannerellaceae bacterium]